MSRTVFTVTHCKLVSKFKTCEIFYKTETVVTLKLHSCLMSIKMCGKSKKKPTRFTPEEIVMLFFRG